MVSDVIIAYYESNEKFPDVKIRIPKSVVIGTKEFDKFINNNNLLDSALVLNTNTKVTESPKPNEVSTVLDTARKEHMPKK